jgi:ElaA protein
MEMIVRHFRDLTATELYAVLKARVEIFVVEQKCAYPEIDGRDENAYHVLLMDQGRLAAYCRVLDRGVSFPEVSIGRVLSVRRGQGLGEQVLQAGIRTAVEQYHADRIRIEAQSYAVGFYERQGFVQVSDEFLEDGIPHVQMLWQQQKTESAARRESL